ncbi:MAG: zf-HC2 domain-containing protein [Acidobacteriota bacterium]
MNCEHSIELLPWYLNGTLDEGESREVREHLAGCEDCRQALEDTRLAAAIYSQHIPSEALVALAWGEPPEGHDPEVLERHLQSCPDCAADFELVRTSRQLEEDDRISLFSRPAPRAPAQLAPARAPWRSAALAASLAGMVAASGWIWTAGQARDLEHRLAEVRPAPVATALAPQAPPEDAAAREKLAEMSAQVETLRRQTEEMRGQLTRIASAGSAGDTGPAPRVNVEVVGLRPAADVIRGASGEATELPAGASAVAMLEPAHQETHKNHRIEVVDASGKVVWSGDELHRSEQGDFTVLLPALKPGSYTIRLSATEGGKRVELESYAIRVR